MRKANDGQRRRSMVNSTHWHCFTASAIERLHCAAVHAGPISINVFNSNNSSNPWSGAVTREEDGLTSTKSIYGAPVVPSTGVLQRSTTDSSNVRAGCVTCANVCKTKIFSHRFCLLGHLETYSEQIRRGAAPQ